jgi:hypothetical protein
MEHGSGAQDRRFSRNMHAGSGPCLLCGEEVSYLIAYPHTKRCLHAYEEQYDLTSSFPTSPPKKSRSGSIVGVYEDGQPVQGGVGAVNSMHPQHAVVAPPPPQPNVQPGLAQPAVAPVSQVPAQANSTGPHRCDLGSQLCPKPDPNTKKSVTFEVGNQICTMCKFQHAKSPAIVAVLQAKLEHFVPNTRTVAFECFGCHKRSNDVVTVFCKNRVAVHEFCNIKCALFTLSLYKQGDWERAVEKNERMPPSSNLQ